MGEFWHECGRRVAGVLATLPNQGRYPFRAKWVYFFDAVGYLGLLLYSWFLTSDSVATHPLRFVAASLLFFGVFVGRFQQQSHALGHFMLFKSDALTVALDHFMLAAAVTSAAAFSFTSYSNIRKKAHLPRAESEWEFGQARGPYEHQIIHHVRGATMEEDGCRNTVSRSGFYRLGEWDEYKPFHRFQTSILYQWVITGIFIHKRQLAPTITRIPLAKAFFKGREFSRFVASVIGLCPGLVWLRFLLLPLFAGTLQGVAVYMAIQFVPQYFGLDNTHGLLFYAQHRWDLTHAEEEVSEDWGKFNAETCCSFWPTNSWHPNMWFLDRTCPATLSFHLEHTLFPGVSYYHLKDIAPTVEQCCKEYGVDYLKFVGQKELQDWQQALLRDHATPKKM